MHKLSEIINGSSYKQKLQTDEWKSYRKEMRETKGDFCQCCKAAAPSRGEISNLTRLELHHIFYDATREPWEYEADEVILLCQVCHNGLHKQLQIFRKFVFGKLTPQSMRVINGALAVGLDIHNPLIFAHALAEFVSNPRLVERYAASFEQSSAAREAQPNEPV